MKWWLWILLGIVVFALSSLIGWSLYKSGRKGNTDSLEKARQAKAERDAAIRAAALVDDDNSTMNAVE